MALAFTNRAVAEDQVFRRVPLESRITHVQPMTGLVLWDTSEHAATDAIQLEFSYLGYNEVVQRRGEYDWSIVDAKLTAIAGRGHQAIFRFYDTYPGRKTTVPDYVKALSGYREITARSENKPTGFPDWSSADYQQFVLEFYERFGARYDRDPRLAFLEVGFGLWSEYHIYDGPEELGRTFPSKEFQAQFFEHLAKQFPETPWMISVDAADEERAPFAADPALRALRFGLFDDSFLCRQHATENEPNWNVLGRDRWKQAPAGGEFSYYTEHDQRQALAAKGPHGESFEDAARRFHLTFLIASDQPEHAGLDRVHQAGLACGYRFRIESFESSDRETRVSISNQGLAPIYFDAFPAIGGRRSSTSLKGLLPAETRSFVAPAGGSNPELTIECDRLSPGQRIEFEAKLSGTTP